MKHGQNQSHDLGKYFRGSGEAKTEDLELVNLPECYEPKKFPALWMDAGPEGRRPSGLWRLSIHPSELHGEPVGWSPS